MVRALIEQLTASLPFPRLTIPIRRTVTSSVSVSASSRPKNANRTATARHVSKDSLLLRLASLNTPQAASASNRCGLSARKLAFAKMMVNLFQRAIRARVNLSPLAGGQPCYICVLGGHWTVCEFWRSQ